LDFFKVHFEQFLLSFIPANLVLAQELQQK
jgi:hypothetical protein